MEHCVKNIWERRPVALRNPPSMFVVDVFSGHLSGKVKAKFEMKICDLVMIPGDITSQFQPLDLSVSKPFKDHLRKEYEAWLPSENLPLTGSGELRRTLEWVSSAWKKIVRKTVEQ
jgi:hypothetical protein